MGYIKWAFWISFWVFVASFFHYTLPQHDIARVTDTYEKRIDFGENSIFWAAADTGNATTAVNRDVFFVQTRLSNDNVMVYRNEDTGWGWPPYFKFDTTNLQAEASDLKSVAASPQWVVIKHYGWRNEFLSIFPNAVSVRAVDSPDVRIIPWLNIAILIFFAAFAWAVWVRWHRFREARIDPVLQDAGDSVANTSDSVKKWFGSWRK
jgi:hypothetical protein